MTDAGRAVTGPVKGRAGAGVHPDVATFVGGLRERTAAELGDDLVALYVVGSVATGDARPASSDVDVLAVARGHIDTPRRSRLADAIVDAGLGCPWAGVEYVVYEARAVAAPRYPLAYELNVNAGPRRELVVRREGDPPHWFLLDVAMARQHAIVLHGRAAVSVLGEPARRDVARAISDSLGWHSAAGHCSPDAVLNACRSWHYLLTSRWLSKTAAGMWALGRDCDQALVRRALDLRAGRAGGCLDAARVGGLLGGVAALAATTV